VERLERGLAPLRIARAAGSALRFQRLTGTSFTSLLREGFAMKRSQELTWAQIMMAPNAPMLTRAALVEGHPETGVLPVGQVVGLIDDIPTVARLVERIMAQAGEALRRIDVLASTPR